MDYDNPQFTAAVKRVLIEWVNKAQTQMNSLDTENHQGDAARDVEQTPTPIERRYSAVKDAASNGHAKEKQENWPQGVEAVCAVLLVVITGFYTYYAAGQLHKMKRSTDAAEKAANTAEKAVHLSERAYITTSVPDLIIPQKFVSFSINNNGRMPSGAADITVHWFTVPVVDPHSDRIDLAAAIDKHWQTKHLTSVSPVTPFIMKLPVSKVTQQFIEIGSEQVIVVGFITYNDGFPDTPTQRWPFCANSGYHTIMKVAYMTPCDPDNVINGAQLADGYPNNGEHD